MPRTPTDSNFGHLTEQDIQAQTDDGSFSRGRSYARQGRIHDTVLRGDVIEALCDGSGYLPYVVHARLARPGEAGPNPKDFSCTCPRGDFCKHIVALLLTWVGDPARFVERPSVATAIAGKSPEELAALVQEMIRRYPDLELLLDTPMAAGSGGSGNAETIDEGTIRRQVQAATMYLDGWEWGSARTAARALEAILDLGRRYGDAGQWANAHVVYATVAADVIGMFFEFDDSDGDLTGIITDCDIGLAQCLEVQADLPEPERLLPQQRERLVRDIYDIWRFDALELGGIGLSDRGQDALAMHVTDTERQMVEEWLREEEGDDVNRRSIIGFFVTLREEAGATDEELLEIYREAEQWDDVAAMLVEMGRVSEAISIARRHINLPVPLTGFADVLVQRGGDDIARALTLIDDRLWEQEGKNPHVDTLLQDWLIRQYSAHGRPLDALAMARKRFAKQAASHTYAKVRDVARLPEVGPGTWDDVRAEMLETFRQMQAWTTLADIYLEEGDVGAALEAHRTHVNMVGQLRAHGSWYGTHSLQLAKAAERDFPDEAIAIYRAQADQLIGARNRGSYREAAAVLARVKATLEQHGKEDEWPPLIADLRTTHKTLRALQDELDKAGL
jgi:uncharacterized Zn finger protein